ncbi:C6 zinc finger domain-containing protein [Pleurostoma richardsiae]|uniref:C6 zinc finger domain-containing protein n=1 Tax=Pleurostoma richardsiae TaxID=41990 RepID=A0AA38RFW0_9PEZI|nr:C6 zinc finger domain-containing protein [Pleurostoma richardsiae]
MAEPAAAAAAAAPLGGAKKKFAAPPVKNACLSCRASRTRCDGGKPCASCQSRCRQCEYRPSRRGGPRRRRTARPVDAAGQQQPPAEFSDSMLDMLASEMAEKPQDPISVQNYIDPGAGLKQLEDWFQDSDLIFDTLFMSGVPDFSTGDESSPSIAGPPVPVVRTYKSDAAILDAYYVFIHPYFPILPAPTGIPLDQPVPHFQNQADDFTEGFEPSSPISLAIAAVLALIPCPNDANHTSHEAVVFRRKYAQYLAQSAIESIEIEAEIPESSVEPQKALSGTPDEVLRQPFHHAAPIELETIIALDILSVYEYAQRGNLKKMQSRAGQALVSAMALSLHCCSEEDQFSEARRRVWWMTYVCVCQGSIVGNVQPTFAVFGPSFTTKYPALRSDPEAFALFIQAQQAILSATQFVIELNKAVKAEADMCRIYDRMKELELFLEPLNTMADSWDLISTTTSPVDPTEEVLSRSLRCMARIKLNSARIKIHRYCAFYDLPIFSGKHCDLKSKSDVAGDAQEPRVWPACSCSSFTVLPSYSASPALSMTSSPQSDGGVGMRAAMSASATSFPFSSHQSAKICLKSALSIAQAFDYLPYPNVSGQPMAAPAYLSPTSGIVAPRTMPSFACCAMQCAYSLLMVHHKTKSMYPENAMAGPLVGNLLSRLQQGLASIFATLDNYATAFEALGGMRDQIRNAIESSLGLSVV